MPSRLNNIEHPGVVEEVKGQHVVVRIKTQTSCGECRSKSYCGLQDVKDKLIDINTKNPNRYSAGQAVTITLKESLGYKALLIGYLFPLFLLIFTLVLMLLITGSEPLSALIAVSVMIPYYGFVYKYRDKLRKKFNFHIKE